MSVFPAVKYNNFQGWIPESDIDGVDAGTTFLSEAINVDIDNGFLKAAVSPTSVSNPTNIASAVSAGYAIISSRKFVHSTRGNCQFYVLYKFSSPNYYLRFFLVDSTYTTGLELNIDEQNSGIGGGTGADAVTISSAPNNINYSIANDQLKINLNCTATYTLIPETVTLNLNLVYLSAVTYTSGSVERAAGWYLFPRWLGFTYDSVDDVKIYASTNNNQLTENCADITPESWVTINNIVHQTTPYPDGWKASSNPGTITLSAMTNVKNIKLDIYMEWATTSSITVTITKSSEVVYTQTYNNGDQVFNGDTVQFDTNLVGSNYIIVIEITGSTVIQNIEINGFAITDYCVIAKYSDGQRALLTSSSNILPDLLNAMYLKLNTDCIDWRVYSYEIYVQVSDIFYLASEVAISSWVAGEKAITWTDSADLAITLNSNYGLGATVRVDNQRTIYSEVLHRNRAYTVNNDYRVYQSHISGTGLAQPDSFPYSTTNFYGFFELAYQERGKALAVTALDELLVLTDKNAYVYYIQLGQGIAFKKIKSINGDVGILYSTSLIRDLDGSPSGEVLAWVDYNGIYLYGGGLEAPIDIALQGGIRNNWQALMALNYQIYGFYNPVKKELWFCYTDTANANVGMVYIYEIKYGRFRKYALTAAMRVAEFIGVENNKMYWVTGTGAIYNYDYSGSTKMVYYFATHYTTALLWNQGRQTKLDDDDYKILQEVMISVKDVDTTATQSKINVTIYIDGVAFALPGGANLVLYLQYLFDKILAPLGVQFRKIKLYFFTFHVDSTDATIREVGFSYSTMNRGLGQ